MFSHIIHLIYNQLYLYEYNLEHLIHYTLCVTISVYSFGHLYWGGLIYGGGYIKDGGKRLEHMSE